MPPKGEKGGKTAPKTKKLQLPKAENGVITRFPPEPSGYLHIGHAKAAFLNDYYGHDAYDGKMYLRLDDTNVDKETGEFSEAIIADVQKLGIKPDQISHTSDYFDQIDERCVQLIKAGKAFADDTPAEEMSRMRSALEPSAHRDDSIEDNLKRFDEMKSGSEEGKKWCIRAKMFYDSVKSALRDPVIYRCPKTTAPHVRTGTKYKAYPTYQLACPVVDSIEGITHALRTTEYNDQEEQYKWLLKALEMRPVHLTTISKIEFDYTLMSKRKLTKLVDNGTVRGWDDPRLPTLRGVLRRGMTVEGLRDFMISQGASKNVVHMDWHTIWAFNKKVIDPKASRYTAVDAPYVKCKVNGLDKPAYSSKQKLHAKYDLGEKDVWYSENLAMEQEDARTFAEGEEITLMNWGNAVVKKIEYEKTGDSKDIVDGVQSLGNVATLELDLHLEGDVKSTKKKVTWLSLDQDLAKVELVDFDYLLSKDQLTEEEEANFEKYLTPKTEFRKDAFADTNVFNIKVDDIFQFDRKGYYRCDVAPTKEGTVGVFFKVPTGK